MKKGFVSVALCAVLFLIAPSSYGVTDEEVVIGLNIPVTGPYSLQGKDQLNAYQLAKQIVEAQGGILGRKIRYLVEDSKSDPKLSVENVKQFIAQGVDMVTGGSSSGVAVAVSKLCQEKKKLFMATLTYSNDTTGKDAHRYCFRETYNGWMAANALSRSLNRSFANKKYFYITSDYTWGWTTRDSMKKFTRTENATDVLLPLGTPNGSPLYRDAIKKAMDEKADVLVLVLFGRDMIAAIEAATEMGAKEKMRIVVPNLEMHMALGAANDGISGVIGAMPWYWEVPYKYNYEKGINFIEAYQSRFGKPPCSGAATAYTNIMLYKWAVEQTKSFDPKEIIRVLEGHRFVMLKDEEWLRPWDHQGIQTVYVVRGREPKDRKTEWSVFEILEAHGGEELAQNQRENPVKLEEL